MRKLGLFLFILISTVFFIIKPIYPLKPTTASIDPSYNFEIQLLDQTIVNLSYYEAQPILLDFFATWAVPCLTQHEELHKVHDKFVNLTIISISIDPSDTIPVLSEFKSTNNLKWIVGRDVSGQGAKLFAITTIPTILYFGYSGELLKRDIGVVSFSTILEWIESDTDTLLTTSDSLNLDSSTSDPNTTE